MTAKPLHAERAREGQGRAWNIADDAAPPRSAPGPLAGCGDAPDMVKSCGCVCYPEWVLDVEFVGTPSLLSKSSAERHHTENCFIGCQASRREVLATYWNPLT